jgi:hypothetical protein
LNVDGALDRLLLELPDVDLLPSEPPVVLMKGLPEDPLEDLEDGLLGGPPRGPLGGGGGGDGPPGGDPPGALPVGLRRPYPGTTGRRSNLPVHSMYITNSMA